MLKNLYIRRLKGLNILAFFFLSVNLIFSQTTIAGWDFSTLTGGLNNYGPSPYSATTSATGVTIGGLTRGTGVTTINSGAASAWGGNGFTSTDQSSAITANDFVTFTITANAGYAVSLTQIAAYNIRRSGTGPTDGIWQYRIGSGSFVDIGSSITWGTITTSSGNPQSAISLSSISALQNVQSGTTITFRVPNWGGASAGNWYFNDLGNSTTNDLIVTGTASLTSIAISAAHPAASQFTSNVDNIVGGFQLDVTNANATLTGIGVNTAGTYQTSDINTSGFKFWINSTNDLNGATQLGANQTVVVSGGSVSVSGLNQVITSGTTRYILFTANVATNAVKTRTIGVSSTAFTKFTFSAGSKTGTDPVPASNLSSLPIRLISFQAQAQGRSTLLKWATATEENNRFFSIERSSNGIDFREIGKVDGAGDSYEVRNYAFTDENPLAGINYYRLKQTDFDGHFTYSPVESVTFEAKGGLRLAPTPVQDQLRVELDDCCPDNAYWQVYDFTGRLVLSGKVQAETPVFNLDVENLLPGNYVLRVSSGQTTMTKQFQK